MKKALIVVDYQNDFVDGTLGFEGAKKLEDIIYNKIVQYRKENADIIFTLDIHNDNYMQTEEGKHLPISHCLRSTNGAYLYGKIKEAVREDDMLFAKPGFGSIELGEYLKDKDYELIELCGLVSNICVLSNTVIAKSALPNAHIIVDAKATGSNSVEMDEKTFDILQGIQVEVINRQ